MTKTEIRLGLYSLGIVLVVFVVPLVGFIIWGVNHYGVSSSNAAPKSAISKNVPQSKTSSAGIDAETVGLSAVGIVFVVVGIIVGIIIFLVPIIIAVVRKHPSVMGIAALTILLGWAGGIGWIIAFVWSLSSKGPNITITQVNRVNDG